MCGSKGGGKPIGFVGAFLLELTLSGNVKMHDRQIVYDLKPSGRQAKFRPNITHDTLHKVSVHRDYLSDALDNHSQVYVVYTDLSKAFDRIDHGLLLIKLESFGFSDSLVELIRSYLSDRFMYVGVNGYASKSFKDELE
jgi:hypothetical protein